MPPEKLEIREPSNREWKTLLKAFRYYGISTPGNIMILESSSRNVLLMSPSLIRYIKGLNKNSREVITSAGIKIGELGRRFRISLEGGELLSKDVLKKWIIVRERGEMLFLYGRDIFGTSVEICSGDIAENDLVFVFNRNRGFLGIGRARVDAKRMKEDRVVVENLVDKGEYLRKINLFSSF
jgi:60S ribosome subunit biogenesis protein NIP7